MKRRHNFTRHSRVKRYENSGECFIQISRLLDPHQRDYRSAKFRHHLEFRNRLHVEAELQALRSRKGRRRNLITDQRSWSSDSDVFKLTLTISM